MDLEKEAKLLRRREQDRRRRLLKNGSWARKSDLWGERQREGEREREREREREKERKREREREREREKERERAQRAARSSSDRDRRLARWKRIGNGLAWETPERRWAGLQRVLEIEPKPVYSYRNDWREGVACKWYEISMRKGELRTRKKRETSLRAMHDHRRVLPSKRRSSGWGCTRSASWKSQLSNTVPAVLSCWLTWKRQEMTTQSLQQIVGFAAPSNAILFAGDISQWNECRCFSHNGNGKPPEHCCAAEPGQTTQRREALELQGERERERERD